MQIQPYQHTCPNCIWAGWIKVGNRYGNMYFCPYGEAEMNKNCYFEGGSIVIRFSDEPSDYTSYPISMMTKVPMEVVKSMGQEDTLVTVPKESTMQKETEQSNGFTAEQKAKYVEDNGKLCPMCGGRIELVGFVHLIFVPRPCLIRKVTCKENSDHIWEEVYKLATIRTPS